MHARKYIWQLNNVLFSVPFHSFSVFHRSPCWTDLLWQVWPESSLSPLEHCFSFPLASHRPSPSSWDQALVKSNWNILPQHTFILRELVSRELRITKTKSATPVSRTLWSNGFITTHTHPGSPIINLFLSQATVVSARTDNRRQSSPSWITKSSS